MDNFINKINDALPQGFKLIDCRKKPLMGQLWGSRHKKAVWKIESPRKEFWFRAISSIHRWCDLQGYTDYHKGKFCELRHDDVITYTHAKRMCYAVRDDLFYCILPIGNTWRYRKKGSCSKCIEILSPYYSEGKEFLFHGGQLILDIKEEEEALKMIKVLTGANSWKAIEVDMETLLNYQVNNYPE